MKFSTSFLPLTGWTLTNAVINGTDLELAAGGSAEITLTSIDNSNILPEALLVRMDTAAFPPTYAPTAFVAITILYEDGNYYEAFLPIVDLNGGLFSSILWPSISNYEALDASAFTSLTIKITSSAALTLTEWGLAKSVGDSIKDGALYNGVEITAADGLVITRSDDKARATFNSTTLRMQVGDGAGAWTDKLYYDVDPDSGDATLVFGGELTTEVLNAITGVVTSEIVAGQGYIANLTVDKLDTNQKIARYLASDTTEVRYTKIEEEIIEFIVAYTDGSATEQVVDRNNNPLYWTDVSHTLMTTEDTGLPVTVYVYTEAIKNKFLFEDVGGTYIPKFEMGGGTGTLNYGKGYIYKGTDGLYIEYVSSTGQSRIIKLTDDGIDLTDFEAITYSETVQITGVPQIWVQPDEPTAAKEKDVWIDTDNYSRYDITALTSGITLDPDAHEVLTASGTFTITLHAATQAGIIKRILNVGTGVVTIAGIINGVSGMVLFPNESVELITDGTNWRC